MLPRATSLRPRAADDAAGDGGRRAHGRSPTGLPGGRGGGIRRRAARCAFRSSAAGGLLSLTVMFTPLPNLVVRPLLLPHQELETADIAVILSGGRYEDGALNGASVERTVAGVRLYHRGVVPRLLFTGGPCCGASISAQMADLAADLGVPRHVISIEERSSRTYESALNCRPLLDGRGLRSIVVVTSPLHLRRTERSFTAAGVPVLPVRASDIDPWLLTHPSERLAILNDALHEYLGLAYYRLRGWI